MPKVAIIYLAYKTEEYIRDVADSIANTEYPKEHLDWFIIINDSPDNVKQIVEDEILPREGKDLPKITVIDDGVNRGFAGGNNHGMQWAIDNGYDYVLLWNGDLITAPDTIGTLVETLEEDEKIGSAQPLIMYWHERERVNVSGGIFHLVGYGYARDNRKMLNEIEVPDGEEIAYASGALVLYRVDALRKVGLLEHGFFMYHEDLELGLRLRLAGYHNVVRTETQAFHDYNFSRNPKKFAWIELNRYIVMFSLYRIPTLILMMPAIVGVELATWPLSLMGGWFGAKISVLCEMLKPKNWALTWRMRKRAKQLRVIRDRDLLDYVSGSIEDQEVMNPIVRFANIGLELYLSALKVIVRW